jgi:exopolyphosphatase / guanosine-5'-triphosphate,3'-diphosphate pyrophosphatase
MIAIYDIGTNTIDYLVAKSSKSKIFETIAAETVQIKLGEGSSINHILQLEAIERTIKQILYLQKKHQDLAIEKHIALGTAASRNALNKSEFVTIIKEKTGLELEIISGEKEAQFIFEGIKAAVNKNLSSNNMIIDIGGGSVEFIISNFEEIYFKKSINIGAIKLWETFHFSNPALESEFKILAQHLTQELEEIIQKAKEFKIESVLGAAGCFDTFNELLDKETNALNLFDKHEIIDTCDYLIQSTVEERNNNPKIPELRKNYIVPAAFLVKFVIEKLNINDVYTSNYSLREGVAAVVLG